MRGVGKSYSGTTVLENLSLSLARGSRLALLGPSGSGKSTILNLIAGFSQPDTGDILIAGQPVARIPAHKRQVGVVFQNYALFPHLTVAENIAYPLRRRSVAKAEIGQRVNEVLGTMRLSAFGARPIAALSGGQQQRVAIARAIATRPDVVLMDEPMSALDRALRDELQVELKSLLTQMDATVIYVTHDQREAMALADNIAVINHGCLEQLGPTETLYRTPASAFVARFLTGASSLEARVSGQQPDGALRLAFADGSTLFGNWRAPGPVPNIGEVVELVVRPEDILVDTSGVMNEGTMAATIDLVIFEGSHRMVRLRLVNGDTLVSRRPAEDALVTGTSVRVGWAPQAGRAYPVIPKAAVS
ncbi:MAG TPA: ABC transporter ATP-binding protein [Sphingobium sp.]